jgi:hypothetical protein
MLVEQPCVKCGGRSIRTLYEHRYCGTCYPVGTVRSVDRAGKPIIFESVLTDEEAHAHLREVYATLSSFGQSLADQAFARLSPKQRAWVQYLAFEASKTKPRGPGKYLSLLTLLNKGKSAGLLYPRVRLNSVAVFLGHKGSAYIKTTLGHIVGELTPDGHLGERPFFTEEIRKELDAATIDVTAHARVFGKDTGRCCFCGLMLENPESVGHGYGPICADKYGLPWGDGSGTSALIAQKEAEVEILRKIAKDLGAE